MHNFYHAFPFFPSTAPDQLAKIAGDGEILPMKPRETIFHMNEPASHLYGVLDGEVVLTLTFKEKKLKTDIEYEEAILTSTEVFEREIGVDTIGPREIFGWSSFVRAGRWTSTARCAREGRLFSLPVDTLKGIFEQDTALGYRFMERLNEIISMRLQNRTAKLIEAWGEAFEVSNI